MCGKHFVALAILFSVCVAQTAEGQCNCPTTGPTVRAASPSPYQYVKDRLVTDSDLPSDLQNKSQSSSIAVADFLIGIAFESIDAENGNGIFLTRWNFNGTRRCQCYTDPDPDVSDDLVIRLDDPDPAGQHTHVSIATRRPLAVQDTSSCNYFSLFACWQATDNTFNDAPELMQLSQPFAIFIPPQMEIPINQTTFNSTVGQVSVQAIDTDDIAPSAGLSCNLDSVLKWESASANDMRTNASPNRRGLLRLFNSSTTTGELVRCCGGPTGDAICNPESCAGQFRRYRPSIIHKGDGTQLILWSEKEVPGEVAAHFNVALRVYKPNGDLAVQRDRESSDETLRSVNEPLRDVIQTDQAAGTLDVDPCGNLVACWVGPMPRGLYPDQPCESDEDIAVYARRMFYNYDPDTGAASLDYLSSQFRVDTSGSEWSLGTDLEAVHPTVAIRQFVKFDDPGGDDQVQGVFCVAWNAIHRESGQKSVRGQFFHGDGRPFGAEFDLSPYKDANGDPDGIDRTLAESNQHTMQLYITGAGNHGNLVATWTADDGTNKNVWFTTVDVQFLSDTQNGWEASTGECIKGDCDGDGVVYDDINDEGDLDDIPPFIELLLDDPEHTLKCDSYVQWQPTMDMVYCRADTNNDGVVNGRDIQCFVNFHIYENATCDEAELYRFLVCGSVAPGAILDCNENDVGDREDIVRGTSLDCQGDGIPDECQLEDNDCDENGVPDDCQRRTEDCNHNGIVDACDITAETSDDCDENGVPDECQADCNNNDVADVCDIADEESDDCNENGVPDECEEDCNGNDVADECDIANSTSEDCNENGVPDECDISRAMLPSLDCNDNDIPDECELVGNDENENGIPDDCEEESLMGGGGGESMMSGGEGGGEFDEAAAWELFFEWYDEEVLGEESDWGTLSGSERFHRIMDELQLLGLPYAAPW